MLALLILAAIILGALSGTKAGRRWGLDSLFKGGPCSRRQIHGYTHSVPPLSQAGAYRALHEGRGGRMSQREQIRVRSR